MNPNTYPRLQSLIGAVLLFLLGVFPLGAATTEPDIESLVRRGRSQYLAGEPTAAAQTFTRVLELDPGNTVAADFMQRIAAGTIDNNRGRVQTTAQMLNEVERSWHRTDEITGGRIIDVPTGAAPSPLLGKLDAITIPSVNFSGLELGHVVSTLSTVSEEFDQTSMGAKGVNIVLIDPANTNPAVSLTLRNASLRQVLEYITDSVGYQFEVQENAVVVRPGGAKSDLGMGFFPVSRSTVLRLTGRSSQGQSGAVAGDPLAGGRHSAETTAISNEGMAIKNFLQLAGVAFDSEPGCTMAFDGSQLIVTHTRRNLERIRNILVRYSEVRQVEIEARFMEVQDGALEELGVNWSVTTSPTQLNAGAQAVYQTSNRSLANAFTNQSNNRQGRIVGGEPPIDQTIDNAPPAAPGSNNLGVNSDPLAKVSGILGEFNVTAVVRALSQKSGTELLSAPKLTVLSGNPATITVAQELRYPQSYGQVQSQVGTGSASGGGSAGVAITAGTPQDFTTRNIGVELKVTPTVEEDGRSISMELNPKVTEFEGFVEYGGQSIAIAGNPSTTVTIPSGFYQPIFGVRELTTKVTIWDGATIVMGGLTREDVRKTNDKVPVLGNVPVLGRLFRSRGESAQKRNLLIFVTANLVSPGGSLKKHPVGSAPTGSLYQSPVIVPIAVK